MVTNSKNAKDVPCLLPDGNLENGVEDLGIWKASTDLAQKKLVAYIIVVGLTQSPRHHTQAKALWRKNKDKYMDFSTTGTGDAAVKNDGYDLVLKHLKDVLKVGNFSDKSSRVISFLVMMRQSN